jgi:cytochrome c556
MSRWCLPLLLAWLACAAPAGSQGTARKPAPKLEAVAETKLLMEGLAQSNLRGLEKMLRQPPADVEAWKFARGQALLIAETGNLLLLRPPHNRGQDAWMERAAGLRDAATKLARAAGQQDHARSRLGLSQVAAACNGCHQTFRVPQRFTPFAEPGPADAVLDGRALRP